jgi:hypothetical protein
MGRAAASDLSFTRAMITAALEGALDKVEYQPHPVFGMAIPASCPGVPTNSSIPEEYLALLHAYDEMAGHLAGWFTTNFQNMPRISLHPRSTPPPRGPSPPALDYNARSHRASDRTPSESHWAFLKKNKKKLKKKVRIVK